jgi:hypothetical protein
MTRWGATHYRSSEPLTAEERDQFKPGDSVNYRVGDRASVPAVVLRVTDKRIVVRVWNELRHRSVRPDSLSRRGVEPCG